MIPRKRLQLLLYVLRVIYVFGEDGPSGSSATVVGLEDGTTELWIDGYAGTDDDYSAEGRTGNDLAEGRTTGLGFNDATTDRSETTTDYRSAELANDWSTPSWNGAGSDENEATLETETVAQDSTTERTTSQEEDYHSTTSTTDVTDETTTTTTLDELTTVSDAESDKKPPAEENEVGTCDLFKNNVTEEIKDVENLAVSGFGIDWISLSWEPPCKNSTEAVYSVSACTGEDRCGTGIGSETGYNATKLNPCTQYTFSVKIIVGDLTSYGVNVSSSTSNDIAELGAVRNLNVHYVTTDAVRLIWDKPTLYPNCVVNYTVTQCLGTDCNKAVVKKTEYITENLGPCVEYFFTVVAVANAVQSPVEKVSTKTRSPKPSEPQHLVAEPSSFSLGIVWQPPKVGTGCVKHYSVTLNKNIFTQMTGNTNVTITGLHACTVYDVSVFAVNEDDENGTPATISQETSPVVTKAPTLYTPEPVVSVNSVMFTWSIEKENNNCLLLNVVTICNYTTTNGHGYNLVNGDSVTRVDSRITDDFLIVNATVNKMSPFTSYACLAYAVNKAGISEVSETINVTTAEDLPSSPVLKVEDITDTSFTIAWDAPAYLAGKLEDYEIEVYWTTFYPVPTWCSVDPSKIVIPVNGSVVTYEFTDVRAFTRYGARIRARTSVGWGNYSEPFLFLTRPSASGTVSKFSHSIEERENDTNILDTILTWGLPCSLNGLLEYFNVTVHGTRKGFKPHSFSIIKHIHRAIGRNEMFSVVLDLRGEHNYTFSVSAKVQDVEEHGLPARRENVLFPAGIPPQPDEEYIRSITIDPYKARRSTTSASILLPLFPNTNGEIIYYSIIISELGYNPAAYRRFDLRTNVWPNVSSWEEAMLEDFTIPYQATRAQWDPYPHYVADYGHMKAVKYVLGEDADCKEISHNVERRLYCNGPLKPDTWYHVRMRAFTYGGYTDSPVFVVKTNAEINVAVVIGIVFGILFLGILTTMMLLVRKCSPLVVIRRFLHSNMPGSPVPAPFTRKKFIAHCQQLVDNPGKLSNEFRLLQTLSVDLQMPTNTACLQANRKKNRYSDILPYDFSRVKLEVIDNDPNTDYINASFIRGYTGEDEYIACQGPKEETTYDFWRMVDQYNVNLIVMLTQLVEKGKEKCHQYFPIIRETFRYESMTIRCSSELDFRTYTQRTLILQKGNKKRSIIHLHFKDWPDHDVPEDFDTMINFCQIMRRNILANKGFAVIHCSAGIGRTGTLITIDILLQHLRDNRKLDVFGTVYRLRHHRINMVQRESQYAYIYNCIKQVLKNPYCLKTYKPPPVDPIYENASKKGKATCNSNTNLVNTLETLKKRNFFMSMDSIGPLYDILPWTNKKSQGNAPIKGLRYSKSTSAIDAKASQSSTEECDSSDCLIYQVLSNLNKESSKKDASREAEEETESTSLV